MKKTTLQLAATILVGSLLSFLPIIALQNQNIEASELEPLSSNPIVQGSSFLPLATHFGPERVVDKLNVVVTAYSSTVEQTDSTPFITASGTTVREGIVAANFIPIGTKIKLPDLYGDRVFTVEDRMHPRKKYQVDIWFPSYSEAVNFGVERTYIEVLAS